MNTLLEFAYTFVVVTLVTAAVAVCLAAWVIAIGWTITGCCDFYDWLKRKDEGR
ncbi:hypothetical protein L2K70_04835 [Nocardioides KLBMP 9356]|uniref:TMhelix containing protein n=1 Tax=Nocardioides potassii TaxID=2911371 RepID=A0ABS9H9M5_9ACTN|nr:hypothetical protein [Nocardioides potassii]MCF6376921.1 hypothetical protein [Nocardioides potassii]